MEDNIYIIPNFEPSELLSYFNNKGISISPIEIEKPTGKSVLRIFSELIHFLGDNEIEDECMEDGRYLFILFKRIDDLLRSLGITFFELKDLQFPSYNRNLNILSTIYNFCIYKESKEEIVSMIRDEKFEQTRKISELKDEISEKLQKLCKMKKDDEKRIKEQIGLNKEIEQLEDEVKGIFKEQKEKINQIDQLKKEKEDKKTVLNDKKMQILNLNQEIQEIKSQIIDDPQKMCTLIKEMEILVKEGNTELENLRVRLNERKNKLIELDRNTILLQNKIKTAVTIQEKLSVLKDLKIDLKKLEEENMNLNSEILFERKRSNSLNKQISHIEMKIENIKNKEKQNSNELNEKLANLKLQYEDIKNERKLQFARIETNQKEIKEFEYETVQLANQHQKHVHRLVGLLEELRNQVREVLGPIEDFIQM